MQDLDKCKRRVIRTVARRLLNEKQPEDVVWEALARDTGCDCRSLWSRLRGLTIKKLDRLLAADDCRDKIAPVAQMTATDWLLCDLVLVHENVDLIGRSKSKIMKNSKSLCELFSLVQRFEIEGETEPINIARKWASATSYYNKGGIECSPMLLQRRWFQLKEATRDSFYKLWNSYKGNHKAHQAILKEIRPSVLQMSIATRYPPIITAPLLKWDDMLQKKLVVLPEEIELYSREPTENPQSGEDLVLVEPVIETIDLGVDDDKGNLADNTSSLDIDETSISTDIYEPSTSNDSNTQIDGLSNVRILSASHIPIENLENDNGDSSDGDNPVEISNEEDSKGFVEKGKKKVNISERKLVTYVDDCNVEDENTSEDLKNIDVQQNNVSNEVNELLQGKLDIMQQSVKEITLKQTINSQDTVPNPVAISDDNNIKIGKVSLDAEKIQQKSMDKETNKLAKSVKNEPEIVMLDDDDDIESDVIHSKEIPVTTPKSHVEKDLEDIIKQKADKYVHRKCNEESVLKDDVENKSARKNSLDDIIKDKAEEFVQKISQRVVSTDEEDDDDYLQCDMIQNRAVEDIIKEKAKEFVQNIENKPDLNTQNFCDNLDFVTDGGVEFVDDGIEYVDDGIDYVDDETPQNNMSEPESHEAQTPKFDEKLLMLPIVYTTKLDDMAAFKGLLCSEVRHINVINDILTESKPVKKGVSKLGSNLEIRIEKSIDETVSDSESEISDDYKVTTSSFLLRKPRTRDYNPIQLCKNPDFNTRLKRLTVGFLSSTRNRAFLKQLKPMTIDLHKAFESKLINGTLYLKPGGNIAEPEVSKEYHQAESSDVMPSAMPIQCLIDNVINDAIPKLASRSNEEVAQRNKVIHLPDITEIRRINQKLLTAKVSPIRIDNTLHSQPNVVTANVQPVLESKTSSNVKTVASSANVTDPNTDEGYNLNPNQHVPNSDINSISVETNVKTYNDTSTAQKSVAPHKGRGYVPKPASKKTPVLPWNVPKSINPESEEFLLTSDTLNKMIYHITGILDTSESTGKAYNKITGQLIPKKVVQEKHLQVEKNIDVSSTQKKDKSIPMQDTFTLKKKQRKYKKIKYCCFAAYKKDRVGKRLSKIHVCPKGNCQCCCRYFFGDTKESVQPLITPGQQRVDIDQTLKNACASIESVVQKSNLPDPVPSVHIEQGFKNVPVLTKIVTHVPKIHTYKRRTNPHIIMPKNNTETSKETSEIIDLESPIYADYKNVLETVPTLVPIPELGRTSTVGDNQNMKVPNFQPSEADLTKKDTYVTEIYTYKRRTKPHIIMPKNNTETSKETSEIIDLESPLITYDKNALKNVPTPDLGKVSDSQSIRVRNIDHLKGLNRFQVNKVTSGTNTGEVVDDDVAIVPDPLNRHNNTRSKIVHSPTKSTVSQTAIKLPMLAQTKVNNFITIDGSQGINIASSSHGKQETPIIIENTKKRKVTRVSLTMPKNDNALPLFIGEHQILLTTANICGHTERKLERSPQKSALPNGINLVILPGFEIKYTVDAGTVLTMEDLDALPAIIKAVKEQLSTQTLATATAPDDIYSCPDDVQTENNSTVVTNVDNPEVVTIARPDSANNSEVQLTITNMSTNSEEIIEDLSNQTHLTDGINVNNDSSQNTLTNPSENEGQLEEVCNVNESHSANISEVQPNITDIISTNSEETTEDPASQTHLSNEKNISNDSNAIKDTSSNSTFNVSAEDLVASSQEKDIIRTGDVTGPSVGSRNLLSDLMEMSGISAEDAAPLPESVPKKSLPASVVVPLLPEATSKPDLGQTLNKSVKLTSISSIDELKCACLQDAKFYKLNCSTGLITRIDVCLKKSKKKTTPVLACPVQTIDLTDENEEKPPESIRPVSIPPVSNQPVSKQPVSKEHISINLKPLAVSKNSVVQRGILRRVVKLQNRFTLKPIKLFTTNPRTLLKNSYKVVRKPAEPPSTEDIDGVPENKETAEPISREAAKLDVPCDSDDSSDDEPLAKKIKRRDETASTSADTHDVETNKETHDMETQDIETQDTELNVPANENNVERSKDDQQLNTNDEESDKDDGEEMEIDDSISSITFFDDGADSGDDCILGV